MKQITRDLDSCHPQERVAVVVVIHQGSHWHGSTVAVMLKASRKGDGVAILLSHLITSKTT